jgi:ribosomal protein L11 methyltransferase
MDYLELTIALQPRDPWAEVLVAELSELGFESFVDTESGIQAYAPVQTGISEKLVEQTSLSDHPEVRMSVSSAVIPHQNWNARWEADFEAVEVGTRLVILAPFHDQDAFPGRERIIIQPQMSFGTGHHQTTYLMSQYLLDLPEMPAKVLDMGTGTGILAILAEKKGAADILAVDIEPWSVENTSENAARNGCTKIRTLTGDIDSVTDRGFGLIVANINKNVLKSHTPHYSEMLLPGGVLLLSGFFVSDVSELTELVSKFGFEHIQTLEKETWAALKLIRK